MKIACPCGAKYSLEVTPEMALTPMRFVCENCGLDASDFVNQLIRQELASAAPAAEPPAAAPVTIKPRLTVARSQPQAQPAHEASDDPDAPQCCVRHQQPADERCRMCNKPICPKCMELFGYVCSPLCKAKASSHGIDIPEYEFQSSVVEKRRWRVVAGLSVVAAVLVVFVLAVWGWYTWVGSVPHPVFSVRFPAPVFSGQARLVGKNQIVFLRGGTLARYDTTTKKEVWSTYLVDKKQVENSVAQQMKVIKAIVDKANNEAWDDVPKFPSKEKLQEMAEQTLASELQLRVRGSNVWVATSEKLVRYDWDSGKPAQEISLANGFGNVIAQGDELLMTGQNTNGQEIVTHVDLASGDSRVEEIGTPNKSVAMAGTRSKQTRVAAGGAGGAGLPVGTPGADAGKPLDPATVADQAQRLSVPGKIALPAVLANSMNQERILAELRDSQSRPRSPSEGPDFGEQVSLLPSKSGHVEFAVRLLESRMVARSAMKPPPGKSALDGDVNASRTMDVANEILNEMQRTRGGDTVIENESRYKVTIRRPDAKDVPDWTGEVIGPPSLIPLPTVNVLTANKSLTVFDKSNKKLWQASLTYNVDAEGRMPGESETSFGQGPCVERGDTLYVFDQAVLTAFNIASGDVRWRLPSVGVLGIFFDDKGMMYVNSTTASPDSVKYSRQIDITKQSGTIILKVDPRKGKILWTVESGGYISRVEGKYIYSVQSYGFGDREEDDEGNDLTAVLRRKKSYMRIRRLDAGNGHVLWEHFQPRAPLDVQFQGNSIQLVFQKEVQVLRFLSF
jgi:PQQ-like domain